MYTVHVNQPDPLFGNLLLERFGGANGEFAAFEKWGERSPFHQGLNYLRLTTRGSKCQA